LRGQLYVLVNKFEAALHCSLIGADLQESKQSYLAILCPVQIEGRAAHIAHPIAIWFAIVIVHNNLAKIPANGNVSALSRILDQVIS
jgi:hypothetical protein